MTNEVYKPADAGRHHLGANLQAGKMIIRRAQNSGVTASKRPMKRREILMGLAGGMAGPAFARSQDKVRRPRIGVLMPGTEVSYVGRLAALRRRLREPVT
jgi:hypothetical protein